MRKRELIIGLWGNLEPETLDPFLLSLVASGYEGDICLFGFRMPAKSTQYLYRNNIIFESALPFLTDGVDLQTSRYLMYLDFISRNSHKYDRVMLSDIRDVFFQKNPFEDEFPARLVFAAEREDIVRCETNRDWIKVAYGKAILDLIGDRRVSCSGTTFGYTSDMLQYLSLMQQQILIHEQFLSIKGLDQGFHNYIVHLNKPRGAILDTSDSMVCTFHHLPQKALTVDQSNAYVDGRVVPVLHQWDRRPAVVDLVVAKTKMLQLGRDHRSVSLETDIDAVVCFYLAERDEVYLDNFCRTLRASGHFGQIYFLSWNDTSVLNETAREYDAEIISVAQSDFPAQNAAHVALSQVVNEITADRVMIFDNCNFVFFSNPFRKLSTQMCFFTEGHTHLSDSEVNLSWLELFGSKDSINTHNLILSSSLFGGDIDDIRSFYKTIMDRLPTSQQAFHVDKSIQGLLNLIVYRDLSHDRRVTLYPNGSVVYFIIWNDRAKLLSRPTFSVNGLSPAIVSNPERRPEVLAALSEVVYGLSPSNA